MICLTGSTMETAPSTFSEPVMKSFCRKSGIYIVFCFGRGGFHIIQIDHIPDSPPKYLHINNQQGPVGFQNCPQPSGGLANSLQQLQHFRHLHFGVDQLLKMNSQITLTMLNWYSQYLRDLNFLGQWNNLWLGRGIHWTHQNGNCFQGYFSHYCWTIH